MILNDYSDNGVALGFYVTLYSVICELTGCAGS